MCNSKKWDARIIVMVFNATFNNTSIISWWSVRCVKKTLIPREYNRHVTSHPTGYNTFPIFFFLLVSIKCEFSIFISFNILHAAQVENNAHATYWILSVILGGGLVFNATLSTIFQLYRDSQYYLWRKPEYPVNR